MKKVQRTDVFSSLVIDSIKKMIELAKVGGFTAKQELNGVTVLVNGDSDAELILRDQQRAQLGCITGDVGPYPKEKLSKVELANDERIHKENEARQEKESRKFREHAEQQEKKVLKELKTCPQMERDEKKWQKWVDDQKGHFYGLGVFEFAEHWARLMQKGISEGKKLEDIASECADKALKVAGISGFQYGCAVSVLANTWKHGKQLRIWHSKDK